MMPRSALLLLAFGILICASAARIEEVVIEEARLNGMGDEQLGKPESILAASKTWPTSSTSQHGRSLALSCSAALPMVGMPTQAVITVGGSAAHSVSGGRIYVNQWGRHYLADSCGPFPSQFGAWPLVGP